MELSYKSTSKMLDRGTAPLRLSDEDPQTPNGVRYSVTQMVILSAGFILATYKFKIHRCH
jgi:hypothetical protein